jgi:hypothetical protein
MAPSIRAAQVLEVDQYGFTIAVALLLRIEGQIPQLIDVERWVKEIDAAIIPLLGADANTPVGVAIRVSERSGKRIAEDLVLTAAVACPAQFERSRDERPTRTIANFDAPRGGITN